MACATCPPATVPAKPSLPDPVPAPGNCAGGEPCEEIQSSDCVTYAGDFLPTLDIEEGFSLTEILKLLDTFLGKGNPASVYIESSASIKVSGANTPDSPIRLHAIPDRVAGNLLRSTKTGLSVLLTKPVIASMLEQIRDDAELQQLFCSICPPRTVTLPPVVVDCLAVVLALADAAYQMGSSAQFGQDVTWTTTSSASLLPAYQLVYQDGANWIPALATANETSSYSFLNLPINRVCQLRLQTQCESGNAESNHVQTAFVTPPSLSANATETSLALSFPHLGADVDSYLVKLLDANNAILTQTTLTPNGAMLTNLFSNLTPGTPYQISVVAVAHGYASLPALLSMATLAIACPEIGTLTVTVH